MLVLHIQNTKLHLRMCEKDPSEKDPLKWRTGSQTTIHGSPRAPSWEDTLDASS